MTKERMNRALKLFGTPTEYFDAAQRMVDEREWELILCMGNADVSDSRLRELIERNGLSLSPSDFIQECCRRAILSWELDEPELTWHIGNFYHLYSNYFLSAG